MIEPSFCGHAHAARLPRVRAEGGMFSRIFSSADTGFRRFFT